MSTSLYTPLDASRREIRLLRVSPSRSKTDMVRCALFTASLDDKPKYWALSYVWGNAAITTPIYVDDRLFSATVNLEAALRHIRGTGVRELIIWVDAVCINQADLDERSSQVALMGAIYSGADLVEAWVGEDEDTRMTAVALDAMERWTVHMDEPLSAVANVSDYVYGNLVCEDDFLAGLDELYDEYTLKAVAAFFGRPYWRRVWIVQELLLAPRAKIVCGVGDIWFHKIVYFQKRHVITKSVIERMGRVDRLPLSSTLLFQPPSVFMLATTTTISKSLFSLSNASRICEATDPRDRLYGLLGLATQTAHTPRPDYAKPVGRLYADFVRSNWEETGKLAIDGSSGIGYRPPEVDHAPIPDLPSWAMNLADSLSFPIHGGGAGRGRSAVVRNRADADPMVLETVGIVVDTVNEYVCPSDPDDTYHFNMRRFVLAHAEGTHPAGMPIVQAFFRTLGGFDACDPAKSALGAEDFYRKAVGFMIWLWVDRRALGPRRPHPEFEEFVQVMAAEFGSSSADFGSLKRGLSEHVLHFLLATGAVGHLYEPCMQNGLGMTALLTMTPEQLLEGFLGTREDPGVLPWIEPADDDDHLLTFVNSLILEFHRDRSLFTTPTGYVGTGPCGIATGDHVCVIPGCEYPLIIRRKGDAYQVVGPCRVYGIMDGELMAKLQRGEGKLAELKLV